MEIIMRVFGKRTNNGFAQFKKEEEKTNSELKCAIKEISNKLEQISCTTQVTSNVEATHAAIADTHNSLFEMATKMERAHEQKMKKIETLYHEMFAAKQKLHEEATQQKIEHEREEKAYDEELARGKRTTSIVETLAEDQMNSIKKDDTEAIHGALNAQEINTKTTTTTDGALNETTTKSPYFVNIHM